jgi:hypothetical protein
MKNMLYFASAAPDGTPGDEEVACFPADRLSHFEMRTATDLRIFFTSATEMQSDDAIDLPFVALNITSGKHKEVMQDITETMNRASGGNFGFINIADSEDSVFCSANITACASITVVDAS